MKGIRVALVGVALVGAVACSGGDDDATDAAGTTAVSTAAPDTAPPATAPSGTDGIGAGTTIAPTGNATEPVFRSLSGFIAAFTAIGPATVPGAQPYPLMRELVTRGTIATGEEAFVSTDGIPNGIIGGTLDPDEGVTAVFVFVDPTSTQASTEVLSLVASTIASNAEFDQPGFVTGYRELATDVANRVGEQQWQPSRNGSGHSLVTTVVEGANGSSNLIEVAIVPIADEAGAKAAVKPLRNAVIGLVG